jgi:hypothetical protein
MQHTGANKVSNSERQEQARDEEILRRADELRASLRSVFLAALRSTTESKRSVRTVNESRYGNTVVTNDAANVMRDLMMDHAVFTRYLSQVKDSSEFRAYEYASASMYADRYADSLAEIDVDEEHEEEKIFRAEEQAERIKEFRDSL